MPERPPRAAPRRFDAAAEVEEEEEEEEEDEDEDDEEEEEDEDDEDDEEEEDDEDDEDDDESDSAVEDAAARAAASTRVSAGGANNTTATDPDDRLELIRLGGLPCSLPDEVLHKVFSCLPIDDHASLALVSPHWSRFARCESLYRTLCQRVYLRQSKRKTLHVSRFGN